VATTKSLKTERLTSTVGAEVLDVDLDRLVSDDTLPHAMLKALEENGVLVFRELHLDDEMQAAFCRKLGELRLFPDNPIPAIFVVSLDPANPYAEYTKATVEWHIDGAIDEATPVKATVLTAKVVAAKGGETEFANAYTAYEDLSDEEKDRYVKLRVFHSFEASQRKTYPNPTPEQLADWQQRGGREQPLVWTHRSGRRSLVLGVTADYVVGWTKTRAGRCWPTCSPRRRRRIACTPTAGRWETRSSGTTAACSTGFSPTQRSLSARCTGRTSSATSRSSDAARGRAHGSQSSDGRRSFGISMDRPGSPSRASTRSRVSRMNEIFHSSPTRRYSSS
jgi:alpha-ketoglutarate-dependent taurine dioxygenase